MTVGPKSTIAILLLMAAAIAGAALLVIASMPASGQTPAVAGAATVANPDVLRWAFLSAALAAGLSTLAAGYAVAMVGSAAVGALAEKPELLGRVLILVGLAEGVAIYGLIVAVLILNRT